MASLSLALSVFCFFIALWSFVCSMMCHGSYGATSEYLHYGLWKYCFKYLDSEDWKCEKLDFWQRSVFSEMEGRIKSGRVLFIMDNVIALFAVFSLIGYFSSEFLSASQRSVWAKTTLVLAAIHAFLLTVASVIVTSAYDDTDHLELGWSILAPWLGAGMSSIGFVTFGLLTVIDVKENKEKHQ